MLRYYITNPVIYLLKPFRKIKSGLCNNGAALNHLKTVGIIIYYSPAEGCITGVNSEYTHKAPPIKVVNV